MAKPKKEATEETAYSDDLSGIVSLIKKDFGKNSDVGLACDEPDETDFVSTGSKVLDLCIHGEGLPMHGKITELLGLFSSGKSLILQTVIANAQKKYDAIGILCDRENAYTKERGRQLGINNSTLIYVGAKDIPTITDAVNFVCVAVERIREKFPERKIVIGLDSIAAFDKIPKTKVKVDAEGNEVEVRSEGKADMGKKAKATHEGMRRLLNYLDRNTMFVFCNQVTFMPGIMFGDPHTSTSGEGPKYYPSVRIKLEQGKKIIDKTKGGEVVGQEIKCTVIKSRLDASYRKCVIPFYYASGLDYWKGYFRLLADRNLVETNTKKGDNAYKEFIYKDVKFKEGQEKIVFEKFPELLYDKYPDWGGGEVEEETDPEE